MHPSTCPKTVSMSHSIREGIVKVASLMDPHKLRMLLKVPEHPLA
jgi:hypothetical protein